MVLEFTSFQLIKLRNHLARVLNLPQAYKEFKIADVVSKLYVVKLK
jgi:hypothetical protein